MNSFMDHFNLTQNGMRYQLKLHGQSIMMNDSVPGQRLTLHGRSNVGNKFTGTKLD